MQDELHASQEATIDAMVRASYTPESAVRAVLASSPGEPFRRDLLEHSSGLSVHLRDNDS